MKTREDFETRFAKMGQDIDEMLSDSREDYKEERIAIKDKWNRLDVRRAEISSQGDSAWEKFKDEIEDSWDDIKMSFEDLRKRFKGE